jgi:Glyoxalase-like domain
MPASLIDRRAVLELMGLASVATLTGVRVADATQVPAVTAVDHLLLGVSDLDKGIAWVEERVGVKPIVGGSHPGRGTRNALLSLGVKQYLEVIAPDPAQSTYTFQMDIRSLKEPRLITWAASSPDLEAVARGARAAGRQVFGPSDGSRARPDGRTLRWRSLGIGSTVASGGVEPIPFFIQWAADTVHPAQDSPKGGVLTAFRLAHPDPPAVLAILKAIGLDIEVMQAPDAGIHATIATAKGAVELR